MRSLEQVCLLFIVEKVIFALREGIFDPISNQKAIGETGRTTIVLVADAGLASGAGGPR